MEPPTTSGPASQYVGWAKRSVPTMQHPARPRGHATLCPPYILELQSTEQIQALGISGPQAQQFFKAAHPTGVISTTEAGPDFIQHGVAFGAHRYILSIVST